MHILALHRTSYNISAGLPQKTLIEDRETIFFSAVVLFLLPDFKQPFSISLSCPQDFSSITPFVFLFALDTTGPS